MTARLILAIISTLLEETALVVIVLLGLPRLGVYIPLPGLIALMVVWLAVSVVTYEVGSRALRRKQLVGLPDMVGSRGRVVTTLAPEGLVRIRGELWVAKSDGGEMEPGDGVIVVGQDSLKLIVRSNSTADLEGTDRLYLG
jgi:membrane-bound ClpP family serine protease